MSLSIERLLASKKKPYFKNLNRLEHLSFNLGGSRLDIDLPPHDCAFPEEEYGKQFNIFDTAIYDYGESIEDSRLRSDLGFKAVLKRSWNLYGEFWRSRHIGNLTAVVSVRDTSKLKRKVNCLDVRQFERVVLYDAFFEYGPGSLVQSKYKCPVDWKYHRINGISWNYFEAWPDEREKGCDPYEKSHFFACFYAPIEKDKYITLTFYVLGSVPAGPSNKAMKNFVKRVSSSLRLRLSDFSAQTKREEELGRLGETLTAKDFESWTY
ncbi:hypothetical protein [Marinimicrobium locisalis]|uniref:hypothetical protein n=1 Tax=Marinimicrobium locisalis TaxID=546022 RepID=UPI0032218A76